MADCFVRHSLQKQLDIAETVRSFQNFQYILFDPTFIETRTIMVDKYRVSVDATGRRAILNAGAQACFNAATYYSYADHSKVTKCDSVVFLPKLN
nr:MAG: ORF5 protein [Riboviria sp.]